MAGTRRDAALNRGVTLLLITRVLASIAQLANTRHRYEYNVHTRQYIGPRVSGYSGTRFQRVPGTRVPVDIPWKSLRWQLILSPTSRPLGSIWYVHTLEETLF